MKQEGDNRASQTRTADLKGIFDVHVHCAPDVRPRWHDALELAELASTAGMEGFVLKNHHRPTVDEAAAARARFPALHVSGGIVLNRAAGGLDPERVRDTLAAGGRVVWLPTIDGCGESTRRREVQAGSGGLAVASAGGEVVPPLRRIMELIAEADAVLATGHVSAEEVTAVLSAASRAGVRRLLVNHPEIPFLNFSTDLQKRWRDEGALLERCFPRPEAHQGFDRLAREIQEVGVDSTVLASDLGRRDLPSPLEGWQQMIAELAARGMSADELDAMASRTPLRLIAENAERALPRPRRGASGA